ncbi:MAG TPA: class I SAM-dependent methyltransferase [Chitinophagales bacterium]|nr:class I SAM-dependent methyltransferase [Chitinophagales bacterium]
MSFKDHFSSQAADYVKFRPRYPGELYEFIFSHVKNKHIAWDAATGNGQVAIALAEVFDKVIATDASVNQINHAKPHPKVIYKVSTVENSGIPDGVADLITVGQALQWFNYEKFFSEVNRVAKRGCFFAAWGYTLHHINTQVDAVIHHYYKNIVGPYWTPERKEVDNRYQTIPFPFPLIDTPAFTMRTKLNMDELLGYLNTWSSTQLYIKDKGHNPLELIETDLLKAWGHPHEEKEAVWPLFMKAGYVHNAGK